MHLSMLSPRVGGGGGGGRATHRKFTQRAFPQGGDFDILVLPWGRELDMVTILED